MNVEQVQDEIIDEFSLFNDWMQRYEYMIELGKSLPLIEKKHKTDDNIIKGCQSKFGYADMVDEKVVYRRQ